jgi:hypothetical protein
MVQRHSRLLMHLVVGDRVGRGCGLMIESASPAAAAQLHMLSLAVGVRLAEC